MGVHPVSIMRWNKIEPVHLAAILGSAVCRALPAAGGTAADWDREFREYGSQWSDTIAEAQDRAERRRALRALAKWPSWHARAY